MLDYHIYSGSTRDDLEEVPGSCPDICFSSTDEAWAAVEALRELGIDWREWQDADEEWHLVEYDVRECYDCPCQAGGKS